VSSRDPDLDAGPHPRVMDPSGVEVAREALGLLRGWRGEFIDFVRELVVAESPSTDPGSQAAVRECLASALTSVGLGVEHVSGARTGGHLVARSGPRDGPAGQLLLGHMDTVWQVGTLSRMPFEVGRDTLRGPGVFDMKTGLAMALFALRSLRELEIGLEIPPTFLITSDEEIGSPESEALINECAGRAERTFLFEPALGPEGRIKTRRKGVAQFTVEVHGKSAHGGLAPEEGASAVRELAGVIERLYGLADPERGLTINVGIIEGGVRPNVVAPYARAVVDVRGWTLEDLAHVESRVRGIAARVPGTRVEISGVIGRAPLEPTPRNTALWESARHIGAGIGLSLEQGAAGGGSDGNFTSRLTATLDGLGAVGDGAHAEHEFVFTDRSLERAALIAGLLALPAGPPATMTPSGGSEA